MSKVAIQGNASGSGVFTIAAPNSNTDRTLTLPDNTGTIVTTGSSPSFPSTIGVGGATPAASGAGITFPGTVSASSDANTLDDYEEGTWTASIAGASSVTNTTGYYTKIGNRVYIQYYSGSFTAGAATPTISGLPYISANVSEGYGGFWTSNNTWTNGFFGYVAINSTTMDSITNSSGGYATINTGGGKAIMVFGFYITP